ncbi:MAG: hypothetical protein AVDCRST_MAG95-700 [uncultured Adhaeribacter sp.]|uniref:Uncharacterized protein n=1 Tax=uncultured Adhaeribacter sp. TaxID=448109 RepID=A0A6J4HH70_9BACT|nr:MAG: hypothetical protein AVDCRST_MAG95-700 [uncultured Adhaeribacter sp.]
MEQEPKKHKTITDDEGHEFTFDNTAEAGEEDIEVIDVTAPDKDETPAEDNDQNTGTVTDEERQASFDMD